MPSAVPAASAKLVSLARNPVPILGTALALVAVKSVITYALARLFRVGKRAVNEIGQVRFSGY